MAKETYSGAGVDEPKHKWAGRKFCDCWRCTDEKASWAGEMFAE